MTYAVSSRAPTVADAFLAMVTPVASSSIERGAGLGLFNRSAASNTALIVSWVEVPLSEDEAGPFRETRDATLLVNRMQSAARSLLLMRYATIASTTAETPETMMMMNSVVRKNSVSSDVVGGAAVPGALSAGGGGGGRGDGGGHRGGDGDGGGGGGQLSPRRPQSAQSVPGGHSPL